MTEMQTSAANLADRIALSLGLNSLSRSNLTRLLTLCLADAATGTAWTDLRYLAYALATAYHETGKMMNGAMVRFAPIEEAGNRAYFNKYEPSTSIGKRLGNKEPGDGFKYRGRGNVQITGLDNYARFEPITGKPLVAQPDLACEWDTAYTIMREGMTRGLFTGKRLSDYFTHSKTDWRNARRIINGVDKADHIAEIAQAIHAVLSEPVVASVTATNG